MAMVARNERPATASPRSRRTRLMTVATRAIVATRPTTEPTTRSEALVVTGIRQARQLADTITLLSDRPAQTMPNRPVNVAIQRVLLGWVIASLISEARVPLRPMALLTSDAPSHSATKPSTPTTNSVIGTNS